MGTDLFEFEGENYLIIVHYYSKFPFIEKMPAHCTAKAVVEATKKLFSEQGIPQKVVSDDGPQFSSSLYTAYAKEWNTHDIIATLILSRMGSSNDSYCQLSILFCIRTTPVDSNVPSPENYYSDVNYVREPASANIQKRSSKGRDLSPFSTRRICSREQTKK